MSTPTIVLLHGQPDSSASFWPLRRELLRRLPDGVRVLAPDRPGYGANPLPATGYPGNVRWLQGWLEQVQAGPTVLVGHSWAGGVAILAAARRPPSLAGLVLLASVGPHCVMPIDRVLAAPVLGELIAYATLQLGRPLVRWRARSAILAALAEADRPYGSCSGAAMRHRPVWRSFLLEQRALLAGAPQIDAALPLITAPTVVISGDRDAMIPAATPAGLLAAIGHATGHQVEAGHDLQLRRPVEVAERIAGWAVERFGAALDPAGFDPAGLDPAGLDPASANPAGLGPAGLDPASAGPA
ncbi:alpha/beta fold hydrolase [Jatrophihabitans sp.]|uniref:alpha/beta fold hydrolase n=1 Tax=Jatrophihabitans sp. TaxID=1932789 RepID=UPI002B71DB33|nr:alpha/beta hydrolase [Jatrophihabitans sp.]